MRAVHLTDWLWLSKGISGNLFLGDECGSYWNMKATFVCFCQFCGCARSSSVCSYKWLQHINCRAYRWAHCLCPETFPFSITTNHCSLHFFNTPKIFSLWNDFFFLPVESVLQVLLLCLQWSSLSMLFLCLETSLTLSVLSSLCASDLFGFIPQTLWVLGSWQLNL